MSITHTSFGVLTPEHEHPVFRLVQAAASIKNLPKKNHSSVPETGPNLRKRKPNEQD